MGGKLYILNAFSPNMLPPLNEGECVTVTFTKINLEQARNLVQNYNFFESAIGHEGTAQVLTEQLGVPVPMNRIPIVLSLGDVALVALPATRLPEGAVLSREQLLQYPVHYYLVRLGTC